MQLNIRIRVKVYGWFSDSEDIIEHSQTLEGIESLAARSLGGSFPAWRLQLAGYTFKRSGSEFTLHVYFFDKFAGLYTRSTPMEGIALTFDQYRGKSLEVWVEEIRCFPSQEELRTYFKAVQAHTVEHPLRD
jgi:hypothetical protein